METFYSGWLIKSPPQPKHTHSLFRARWRRRWFVLREGDFRGQFALHYYTDKSAKKLKGKIALDECDQVDSALTVENGRQKYDFIFEIKTPTRNYYLAADTYDEMTSWVRIVCEVCGLRATQDQDNDDADSGFTIADLPGGRPNLRGSEATLISNPYIHISTCYTGGKPKSTVLSHSSRSATDEVDSGRALEVSGSSCEMGDDSVFFPSSPGLQPPGRPPKPAHLVTRRSHGSGGGHSDNYANAADMQMLAGDVIPLPPTELVLPDVNDNRSSLFSRRRTDNAATMPKRLGTSSATKSSHNRHFATLGSGGLGPPPVDRMLKPKNGASSEYDVRFNRASGVSATLPRHFSSDEAFTPPFASNARRHSYYDHEEEQIYFYMPPVNAVGMGNNPMMIPADNYSNRAVAYIDLDLPPGPESRDVTLGAASLSSSTMYTCVDEVKTKALGKTLQNVLKKYEGEQS